MLTPVTGGVLVFHCHCATWDLGGGALVLLVKLETTSAFPLPGLVSLLELTFPTLVAPPLMTVCYQDHFSFGEMYTLALFLIASALTTTIASNWV